jgi:hypothetical protein
MITGNASLKSFSEHPRQTLLNAYLLPHSHIARASLLSNVLALSILKWVADA